MRGDRQPEFTQLDLEMAFTTREDILDLELGGGSVHIHQQAVQDNMFSLIRLSQEEAREQFGFLLEAHGPHEPGGPGLVIWRGVE